jgi:hypothetical protein
MNQAMKSKSKERTMHDIWDSWDWHFFDKLRSLDHMVRHITREMGMNGIPPDMWQPFLLEKMADAIEQCAEQAEVTEAKKRGQKSARQPSSLEAIRHRKRAN